MDERPSGERWRDPEPGMRRVVIIIGIADEKSRFCRPGGAERSSRYSQVGYRSHGLYLKLLLLGLHQPIKHSQCHGSSSCCEVRHAYEGVRPRRVIDGKYTAPSGEIFL
jgi:hypothetical protein